MSLFNRSGKKKETHISSRFSADDIDSEKAKFIRALAKERLEADPDPAARVAIVELNQLSDLEVLGIPEAYVVTFVDSYVKAELGGVPPSQILSEIAALRIRISGEGGRTDFDSLEDYVRYRFQIEMPGFLELNPMPLREQIARSIPHMRRLRSCASQ